MAKLVIEEFRTGANMDLIRAQREHQKRAAVSHLRSPGVNGLGYVASEIPAEIYWNWEVWKPGFWRDPSNREWFLKQNPQYRVKYQPKPRIGWVPLPC